ncbi:NUDIX hydrolase [Bacillus cereus]|uniref:NUDIX hydrolase n=1 Tax=Bacillus cereus TaxID=1396 RepID=UPI000B2EAF3F
MYPRAKAFGLAVHQDRLLVQEYYTEGEIYYRPLGGSIELGEKSAHTVIREFKEELHTEIEITNYLGCLENVFHLDGDIGHEIIQLYSLRLLDTSLYEISRWSFKIHPKEKRRNPIGSRLSFHILTNISKT